MYACLYVILIPNIYLLQSWLDKKFPSVTDPESWSVDKCAVFVVCMYVYLGLCMCVIARGIITDRIKPYYF